MKKKGISAIIATVLIILMTVSAITIVWIAIIPLLTIDSVCSDFSTQVSIYVSGGYTYYNPTYDVMIVQIGRNAGNKSNLSEMRVTINFGGDSGSEIVLAPQPNQARIYLFNLSNFDEEPVKISVAPIFTKGRRKLECDISSSVNVPISIKSIPEGVYGGFGRKGCTSHNDCDDGKECTEDICNGDDGCSNEPVTDGTGCTGGICEAGVCVIPSGEITGCQTLDAPGGNYLLTGDIIRDDLTDDCFKVTAEDVTLDCQGHSITSTNNFAGVYSNNNYTTIKNCIIDMGAEGVGIELEGTDFSYIHGNILRNQYVGINSTGGTFNAVIDDNIIIGNANKGIVFVGDATDNTISNNNISYNLEDGINLRFTSVNNLITNNILENNGNPVSGKGDGIAIDGGNYNTISNNNITNSIDDGIELDDYSEGNILFGNIINSNLGDGIHVQLNSNENVIENNNISYNLGDGIDIAEGSSRNIISGNLIDSNKDEGIQVKFNSLENMIIYNFIINNEDHGIKVTDGSTNNWIMHNILTGSGQNPNVDTGDQIMIKANYNNVINNTISLGRDMGIKLSGANNSIVANNTIFDNQDHGIALYSSFSNNVTNNTIYDHSSVDSDGIFFELSFFNLVKDNNIFNNVRDGIHLKLPSDDNDIISNTVQANSDGIQIDGSSNNISFNIILQNSRSGIKVDGDDNIINYNFVDNNNLDGVYCATSDCAGIYLSSGSNNYIMGNNPVQFNIEGIRSEGDYTTIGGNTVKDNSGDGIKVKTNFNVVSDNLVDNNYDGIQIDGDGATISDNTLDSNNNNGIKITGSNVAVNNNLIQDTVGKGIIVEGTSANTELNGNTIVHISPVEDAIRIEPGSTNTLLIGNTACGHNDDLDCRGTVSVSSLGNIFNDAKGDAICIWMLVYYSSCP